MNNSVIIKHEKYGLRIRLDEQEDWQDLTLQVREKFMASASFFGEANLTLTFCGRALTEKEEDEIIDIISNTTRITILCVFVEDSEREEVFLRTANSFLSQQKAMAAAAARKERLDAESTQSLAMLADELKSDNKSRYQMVLRSIHAGETCKSDKTVIVIGDVEEGACLLAERDVLILGCARGVIRAGEEMKGKGRGHFVASPDLRPQKLVIDSVIYRAKRGRFSKAMPAVAAQREGEIQILPFDDPHMEELFH